MNTKKRVPRGETGESGSKGMDQGITMPRPRGHNVLTQSGRHATGQSLANVGKSNAARSEPAGNRPITGTNTAMRPKPPVLTNQATTSDGAQRIIPRPPMPFENPQGSLNVPAPAHRAERFSGNNATEGRTRFLHSSSASIHSGTSLSADEMAAIGYGPSDTKGTWSIISGQPTKNNQRQAGRPGKVNAGTSAKENARMRQRPGGF